MIRRPATSAELNLDSLTDTMTNMMGLILLLVVGSVTVSGGMKLVLLGQMVDPGDKTPIYFVCRQGQVLYMHRGDRWKTELTRVCKDLESRLGRRPTTSEAILEANRLGLCQTGDLHAMFVRETAFEQGQEMHVVGVRFLARRRGPGEKPAPGLSRRAAEAFDRADPKTDFVYAFVYDNDPGAVEAFQVFGQEAKKRGLWQGWRPIQDTQDPGLSDSGVPPARDEGEP